MYHLYTIPAQCMQLQNWVNSFPMTTRNYKPSDSDFCDIYLNIEQWEMNDKYGQSNQAHRRMLDVDQMLVKRRNLIVVDCDSTALIEERIGENIAGAEDKRVGGYGWAVFEHQRVFLDRDNSRHLDDVGR